MANSQTVSTMRNEFSCRFNQPGATTVETSLFDVEDREFRESDAEAWELTHALIQDAHERGLEESENAENFEYCPDCIYRAPVGDRAAKKASLNPPVPWTGELRVEETGSGDGRGGWWRTYFHDLDENDRAADEVLLSSVRLKTAEKKSAFVGRFRMSQQDRDILNAMNVARKWAKRQNRYELRPWNV